MSVDLVQTAIDQALAGQWKEAVKTNLLLLKKEPQDTESLNRLGRAYLETGQKAKAIQTYHKVLGIDKFNTIAIKNLNLLKTLRFTKNSSQNQPVTSLPVFLEEPGVTKTVTLVRLGDPKIISHQRPGDAVKIVSRQHSVVVLNSTNQYLGRISDDLASRLRSLLASGNTYSAWLRSVEKNEVRVFIKELVRSFKHRFTPSFPLTEKLTYAAFTPPELVHEEKPDVSATEFQDESSRSEVPPEEES